MLSFLHTLASPTSERLYLLAPYWIGSNHISSSRALEQRKALVRAVL